MNGKKWIITFPIAYLLLGGITVCVYASDLGYFSSVRLTKTAEETKNEVALQPAANTAPADPGEQSPEPERQEESSPPAKVAEHTEMGPAEETESVSAVTEEPAQIPETEAIETAETETALAEETEPSQTEEAESAETGETETAGMAEADPRVFYSYTVTELPFEDLAVHPDVDGHNGQIGYLKPGMTGYVIGRGQWRTLIEYEGKFGYISNKYSLLTEVAKEEYPEELKRYSWDGSVAAAAPLVGEIPEYQDLRKDEQTTGTN